MALWEEDSNQLPVSPGLASGPWLSALSVMPRPNMCPHECGPQNGAFSCLEETQRERAKRRGFQALNPSAQRGRLWGSQMSPGLCLLSPRAGWEQIQLLASLPVPLPPLPGSSVCAVALIFSAK